MTKSPNSPLGIIAGNRLLPILCAQGIKKQFPGKKVVAFCFRGETSPRIIKYVDTARWLPVGSLLRLREAIKKEGIKNCIMVGQINPLRLFKRKVWDNELSKLMEKVQDMRPHSIFGQVVEYLEHEGISFLDSTLFLKNSLAEEGEMNGLSLSGEIERDISCGVRIIAHYVELDIGQTIVIKNKSVVALESLEGTDRTITRAFKLAGGGCTVLKFSKINQDLRFDVPVVGLSTLKLLRRVKAKALILEKGRVLILQKKQFLSLAKQWSIPVVGKAIVPHHEGVDIVSHQGEGMPYV